MLLNYLGLDFQQGKLVFKTISQKIYIITVSVLALSLQSVSLILYCNKICLLKIKAIQNEINSNEKRTLSSDSEKNLNFFKKNVYPYSFFNIFLFQKNSTISIVIKKIVSRNLLNEFLAIIHMVLSIFITNINEKNLLGFQDIKKPINKFLRKFSYLFFILPLIGITIFCFYKNQPKLILQYIIFYLFLGWVLWCLFFFIKKILSEFLFIFLKINIDTSRNYPKEILKLKLIINSTFIFYI